MFTPVLLEAHNPGVMTGRGTNTYLVAGADGNAVLVDAGVGHADHLAELDETLSRRRASLRQVVVTHAHSDHASGAPTIAARHPDTTFAKHLWPDEDAQYPVEWIHLSEGDEVPAGDEMLTVLRTPGHSPDHIVLWHEASRSLFAGDLVVLGGSVAIHSSRGGDLAEYLASLGRILALEPARLFPAHGAFVDDPKALLRAHIDHRQMREEQILAALAAGPSAVGAIADCIYDDLGPELLAAARENVRAHLEKLEKEGRTADLNGLWTLR